VVREKVLALLRRVYSSFNDTNFVEKLREWSEQTKKPIGFMVFLSSTSIIHFGIAGLVSG